MRFNDFTDALYDAGWEAVHDAQYSNIKLLHSKLFPLIHELEKENNELIVYIETKENNS